MVKVNEAEAKLIDELKRFKEETRNSLEDIAYGIEFVLEFLNQDGENNKHLNLFKDLFEIIGNFEIDSHPLENGTQTLSIYCKIGTEQYSYREGVTDKSLTEKKFIYLLMLWHMEVNKYLSLIEGKHENNYDYFCSTKRSKLSMIIKDYIETLE